MNTLSGNEELPIMDAAFDLKKENLESIIPEIVLRLPPRGYVHEIAAVVHSYRIQEYARCLALAGDLPVNEVETALLMRSEGNTCEQFYTPDELSVRALLRLMSFELSIHQVAMLEEYVKKVIRECAFKCAHFIQKHPGEDPFTLLTQALSSTVDARTLSILGGPSKKWGEWAPDARMDTMTMLEARNTLPGISEAALPKLLVKYEDPTSAHALVGSVKLDHHDIIHILLRRGLLDQDEAFVLGFTMGTATNIDISGPASRFKEILAKEYGEPYRIPLLKLPAFDLGIQCARESQCRDIFAIPLTDPQYLNMSVSDLRAYCGISDQLLSHFYMLERVMIPHSLESLRLNNQPETKDHIA